MAASTRNASNQEKAARGKPADAVPPDQWPAWKVERKPADWLKPHPNNVKRHPLGQLAELDISFAAHGAVTPFVCNTAGQILKGHGGCDSVTHLHGRGIELPVIVVDWPEEQQREYMVRDNATAELSPWDKVGLGLAIADISRIRGVAASELRLGLKASTAKRVAPEKAREGTADPDAEAPAAPQQPISRLGDIWELGPHRLMCGDATNGDHVAALLAGERPNLMVTDQPYGVKYDAAWREASGDSGSDALARGGGGRATGEVANDDRLDWRAAWRLFPGNVAYVWCASLAIPEVVAALESEKFMRRYVIVWNKNKHAISRGHYHWKHETLLYHVRADGDGAWQGSRAETTVWDIASHGGGDRAKKDYATGHGTQKPIECMARPMRLNSKPGERIYEPFCGSGTTIVAADSLARVVLGLEIDPRYVDVSIRRWEAFTGKRARLAAGGGELMAVAAERGVGGIVTA